MRISRRWTLRVPRVSGDEPPEQALFSAPKARRLMCLIETGACNNSGSVATGPGQALFPCVVQSSLGAAELRCETHHAINARHTAAGSDGDEGVKATVVSSLGHRRDPKPSELNVLVLVLHVVLPVVYYSCCLVGPAATGPWVRQAHQVTVRSC